MCFRMELFISSSISCRHCCLRTELICNLLCGRKEREISSHVHFWSRLPGGVEQPEAIAALSYRDPDVSIRRLMAVRRRKMLSGDIRRLKKAISGSVQWL